MAVLVTTDGRQVVTIEGHALDQTNEEAVDNAMLTLVVTPKT
jgi:hypothetical protein